MFPLPRLDANPSNPYGDQHAQSQRALELRRFFKPFDPALPPEANADYLESLNTDGALDSYAELLLFQLKGVRAMISLLDLRTQYFLAGAARSQKHGEVDVSRNSSWFGCNTVATHDGLCQWTISMDKTEEDCVCFTVPDLSSDPRFMDLPVVTGVKANFRFYVGTPITTKSGLNIGAVFMFDDKPRPGLAAREKRYLAQAATNVMRHLEVLRDAADRERYAQFAHGISTFLERTSRVPEANRMPRPSQRASSKKRQNCVDSKLNPAATSDGEQGPASSSAEGAEATSDRIKTTMDQAATILREAMRIEDGGCVFLGTAVGYNQTDGHIPRFGHSEHNSNSTNNSEPSSSPADLTRDIVSNLTTDPTALKHKSADVLAAAYGEFDGIKLDDLDVKTLQSLINVYPNGDIFYYDQRGHFSSLEQQMAEDEACSSPSNRITSRISSSYIRGKQYASDVLYELFPQARQIMFLPLWETSGDRWHSGVFVWDRSATPVYTVHNELAFLSSFTNSLMAELSRLHSINANKMKADFISSISHEFRSPLHGILVSSELLQETSLDTMQAEFSSNIRNCASILLDTINHVLDYSKINSFERISSSNKGFVSNELIRRTNIAIMCGNTINGIMAAGNFTKSAGGQAFVSLEATRMEEQSHLSIVRGSSSRGLSKFMEAEIGRTSPGQTLHSHDHQDVKQVEVILDFESRDDWNFMIQPGGLQRIIMNLFGNSRKYTIEGFILIRLRVREDVEKHSTETSKTLVINVIDSGKGISKEFLDHKLYTPFAQENTFAPGVGLGLSIIWSIVAQMKGKIHIDSQINKGTDVEITIPLLSDHDSNAIAEPVDVQAHEDLVNAAKFEQDLAILKQFSSQSTIALWRDDKKSPMHDNNNPPINIMDSIEMYCSSWFGFTVVNSRSVSTLSSATVVIVEQQLLTYNEEDLRVLRSFKRVLFIHGDANSSSRSFSNTTGSSNVCFVPIGPYKLARSLISVLRELQNDSSDSASVLSPGEILYSTEASSSSTDSTKPSPLLVMQHRPVIPNSDFLVPTPSPNEHNMPFFKRQDSSQHSLHILAVDDNALNLELLVRQLRKRVVDTIITAKNGRQAVDVFQEASKTRAIDLVFMDISMPELDGFEATRMIRAWEQSQPSHSCQKEAAIEESSPRNDDEISHGDQDRSPRTNRAHIVALTGLASSRDRMEAKESGCDDFLTKPVRFRMIGQMVEKMSREKKMKVLHEDGA